MPPRETLRQIIAKKHLSIAEAAGRAGLSRQAVSAWCHGKVIPWPHKAQALADVLGVPVDRVMRAIAAARK